MMFDIKILRQIAYKPSLMHYYRNCLSVMTNLSAGQERGRDWLEVTKG